jgi:hypothetical protein
MNLGNDSKLELFDESHHSDLLGPLTDLLHAAYAPLAAKGMKYLATHQPPSKTLERLKEGESYLLFIAGKISRIASRAAAILQSLILEIFSTTRKGQMKNSALTNTLGRGAEVPCQTISHFSKKIN